MTIFFQGEVACNPTLRDPNSLWNVEDNYFPKIENITLADMAPGNRFSTFYFKVYG